MSFWTEQDVLHYISKENLEIASVYGDIVAVDDDGVEYEPNLMNCGMLKCTGCDRTGCIFAGLGFILKRAKQGSRDWLKLTPDNMNIV